MSNFYVNYDDSSKDSFLTYNESIANNYNEVPIPLTQCMSTLVSSLIHLKEGANHSIDQSTNQTQ